MTSLADNFKSVCAELKIKPNSAVVKFLGDADPEMTSWDLTGNMIGTKGATAVARLSKESLPKLQSLNLHGNNVGSPATEVLYECFVQHPALTSLDLSGNDVRLGGPSLVELVKKNKRIVELNVRDTYLRPLFERLIAINVQNNKAAAEKNATDKTTDSAANDDDTPKNGGEKSTGKRTQFAFTFGDAAPDQDENFAANEEEAFGAFGKLNADGQQGEEGHGVSFAAGAQGGKKVKRRPTVASEVIRDEDLDNFVPQVNEKDEKDRQWLATILERHDLFNHLDDRELLICVDAAQEAERSSGDSIFEEGDEDGDLFYVIAGGEIDLLVGDEVAKTLKRGDCTQDLMLLYSGSYMETARCTSDVRLFSLDRMTYKCAVGQASKKKRAMYEGFLKSVAKFKCLTPHEILQLADALKPAIYEPGKKLINFGEDGTTFFLIVEGTVEVFGRDDDQKVVKVCEFTAGDCIGELEFLNDHKCVADVAAKDEVRVAKMNRHHFEMVMGPVKELLARTANESEVYSYYRDKLEKMGSDPNAAADTAKDGEDADEEKTKTEAAPAQE